MQSLLRPHQRLHRPAPVPSSSYQVQPRRWWQGLGVKLAGLKAAHATGSVIVTPATLAVAHPHPNPCMPTLVTQTPTPSYNKGFGNNTADYTAPFGSADEGLATQLRERGWHVEVLELERKSWFNVARGLLTLGLWRGTLTTDPGYSWCALVVC